MIGTTAGVTGAIGATGCVWVKLMVACSASFGFASA